MGTGKAFMRGKMALVSPDGSNGNAIEDGEQSTHLDILGIVGGLHGSLDEVGAENSLYNGGILTSL